MPPPPQKISSYKFPKLISIHFLQEFFHREFDKRSMHFLFGDHFDNSPNLFFSLRIDIVRRRLVLVSFETSISF